MRAHEKEYGKMSFHESKRNALPAMVQMMMSTKSFAEARMTLR